MSIPPTAKPNRLGVLAGDVAGLPERPPPRRRRRRHRRPGGRGRRPTRVSSSPGLAGDRLGRSQRSRLRHDVPVPRAAAQQQRQRRCRSAHRGHPSSSRSTRSRVLETRTDQASGQIGYNGIEADRRAASSKVKVDRAGSLVPDDATTVFLNVIAVNTAADGFVTVFPCGSPQPFAASFNPIAGAITHNLVAAKVGTGGNVCIFTSSSTDLVADIAGFHPATSQYVSTAARAAARDAHAASRAARTATPVPSRRRQHDHPEGDAGVGTANVPADAKAVFLNVAAVNSHRRRLRHGVPVRVATTARREPHRHPRRSCGPTSSRRRSGPAAPCACTSARAPTSSADLQGFVPKPSPFVSTVPERVLETRETDRSGQLLGEQAEGRPDDRGQGDRFRHHQDPVRCRHRAAQRVGHRVGDQTASSRCSRAGRRDRSQRASTSPVTPRPTSSSPRSATVAGCASTPRRRRISSPTSPGTSRVPSSRDRVSPRSCGTGRRCASRSRCRVRPRAGMLGRVVADRRGGCARRCSTICTSCADRERSCASYGSVLRVPHRGRPARWIARNVGTDPLHGSSFPASWSPPIEYHASNCRDPCGSR